ncbi:Hypothetical predicted protein, partial [Pelobates cultripes]
LSAITLLAAHNLLALHWKYTLCPTKTPDHQLTSTKITNTLNEIEIQNPDNHPYGDTRTILDRSAS